MINSLVGGFNLPLWKIWVRHLGWWNSQLNGKIKETRISMEYSNKMINGCGYFRNEISGYIWTIWPWPSRNPAAICGVHPILEAKHFAFGLQPLTRPDASAIADGVANGSPCNFSKGTGKGQRAKSGWFLGRSAGKSHNSFGRCLCWLRMVI